MSFKSIKNNYRINKAKKHSARLIRENQRAIIELSKTEKHIRLISKPLLNKGSISHYFHFISDLLAPISHILPHVQQNVTFSIAPFGGLEKILAQLFDGRVKVEVDIDLPTIDLIGMNPRILNEGEFDYSPLRQQVFHDLKIKEFETPNKILLIERAISSSAELKKDAGSTRRSILNHEELKSCIQSHLKPEFELISQKLEEVSFREQVELFNQSCLVIGQHGAGLANVLWMQSGNSVIEFGYDHRPHFERFSQVSNLHYLGKNFKEAHITIDCNDFFTWIRNDPSIDRFFKSPVNTSSH